MGISIYDISPDVKNKLGYYRFNERNATCPENLYDNFIDGIFKRSEDSFFFINMVQFFIVTFMYYAFGKGKYWNILFYAAVSGGIASLLENITLAYICRDDDFNKKRIWLLPFFIAEFFWIMEEYSIPFLNLIKMETFPSGSVVKMTNSIVIINFFIFSMCRFWIGFSRMRYGILHSANIGITHALAFTVMAVSDIICTLTILYFFKRHKAKYNVNITLSNYIRNSSFKILIWVDVVSVFLAIFQALTQFESLGIPNSLVNPFQCAKCGFILILAIDSLLYKYRANKGSLEDSYHYHYNNGEHISKYNKFQYKKSQSHYSMHTLDTPKARNSFKNFTKIKSTSSESSLRQCYYQMDDLDSSDDDGDNDDIYQNSIIKNYTNIKLSQSQQSPILFSSLSNHNNDIYNNAFYQNSQCSTDSLIPKEKH